MKRTIQRIATLLAAVCLITGCEGGYECSLNNIAYNRIGFYTADGLGNSEQYALPEILTVKMMINGRDSIVVNHIQGAKEVSLPVSYAKECDTVIFSYEGRATDTLYVQHTNIPIYQSMECGVIMHHTLTGLRSTGSLIDSTTITDANVNFENNENIKVYFVE
jgi:hypothetical protein